MTTDFVVTITDKNGVCRNIARAIKASDELSDMRVKEKLLIEKEYWRLKGCDWGIVTEKEIPHLLVDNINVESEWYLIIINASLY